MAKFLEPWPHHEHMYWVSVDYNNSVQMHLIILAIYISSAQNNTWRIASIHYFLNELIFFKKEYLIPGKVTNNIF